MTSPIPIFISAGEASGDMYGALLIRGLRARLGAVEFFGCGGERMKAEGCETLVDAREIAMVGLVEVVPGLPRVARALYRLVGALRRRRPALAILIDFPDFNLRLARKLKREGVEVIYFIAPQVWAWRRGRLPQLRKFVDRLLCIFPFEEEFFRKEGVSVEFVGHPLVGRVAPSMAESEFRSRWRIPPELTLIALLPGSRRKEVELNLPPMMQTVEALSRGGQYGFLLAAGTSAAGGVIRRHLQKLGDAGQRLFVIENHTYDAVAHSAAAIVASGTATIETALLGTPMAVVYRVTPLSWFLGRRLVSIPFYSMVNLVMGREIVGEFIQDRFLPELVAAEIRRLLDHPSARDEMKINFQVLVTHLSVAGPATAGESPATAGVRPQIDAISRAVEVVEASLSGRLREHAALP